MKRAGRAVELRPAPKAGRGTECARPELSVCGACAALRKGPSPEGRRRGWRLWPIMEGVRGSGRHAPRARPEGDAQKSLPF